jgi:hypothetical protein
MHTTTERISHAKSPLAFPHHSCLLWDVGMFDGIAHIIGPVESDPSHWFS